MLIKIATDNTTTGNPRRGWLQTDEQGQVLNWIEEGYEGRGAIQGIADYESPTIYVKPMEYKRLKNWGTSIHTRKVLEPLLKTGEN